MSQRTILIADDDSAIRTVLSQALTRAGYSVRACGTAAGLWQWVSEGQGDVVITDVVLPDGSGFDLLPRIKKVRPSLPIIVMSAQNTIMTAITATERGAYDYLSKPFDLNALVALVGRAADQTARPASPALSVAASAPVLPIIGRSGVMQEIYRIIARLTQTDLTVLIEGESGTGKELVARALHDFGKRKRGAFVAVNMAAIPRDLIESELFGHEKGAFAGATSRMVGRFEQAEGGTLFLDEIGDMPIEAQTRLLRVLQQGEYSPVGSIRAISSNVRIVAATHRDLRHSIAQGTFREDLFFRLNVVPLRLPPLRERSEDIPDLVRHFLEGALQEGLPPKIVSSEALDVLRAWRWPGNVRELENLMRRIAALHVDETITAASVTRELGDQAPRRAHSPAQAGSVASHGRSLPEFLEDWLGDHFANYGQGLPPPGLYERLLAELEPPILRAALAATRGNQIRAAELLGINRNTLRTKMRERAVRAWRG